MRRRNRNFDPFDERLRDRVKRRRTAEVKASHAAVWDRLDRMFEEAIASIGEDKYLLSWMVLEAGNSLFQNENDFFLFRRNLRRVIGRLKTMMVCDPATNGGRVAVLKFYLVKNLKSSDGRWKLGGRSTFVFRRYDQKELGQAELNQKFGWN